MEKRKLHRYNKNWEILRKNAKIRIDIQKNMRYTLQFYKSMLFYILYYSFKFLKEAVILSKLYIPENYSCPLTRNEVQHAIEQIKLSFQQYLGAALNLIRVSAPLFVPEDSGLNDDLSGVERAVSFDIPDINTQAQVVHSLAKWKRTALHAYGFSKDEGLFTDMNAIRRDEVLDNIHSVYVDQWDWEKIISREERNLEYLKNVVERIISAICLAHKAVKLLFPAIKVELCEKVTFITAQELEDLYPALTPEEREYEFTKAHKTVFIMQIGDTLASGIRHGSRAPDYDDWALNGDLLCWSDVLGNVIELSSMGIRVDSASLQAQLEKADCNHRLKYKYHQQIVNDELPLTIGGGIGQSRLCMLMLGCAHIGEVQSSIWDRETRKICKENGIFLL